MDNTTQNSVLQKVDEQSIVNLASELIKIPSFAPGETPVAEFLGSYFRERGYQVDMQEVEPGRFQTIATLKGNGNGKSLMFNGHIDINSLTHGQKRDPWAPSVEGDRLYGHGIQNMKGGVAAMIGAAEAIRLSGTKLEGDLVIACVDGETQGGEGSYYLMQSGLRTDMAVVAEPFGIGNVTTVHAGIVHMAIHTYGVTGHISGIENTVNAVHKMANVVNALQQTKFTFKPHPGLPAMPRMNIGSIIGGRGQSYVLTEPPYIPDLCTIFVDVHFVPGMTVDSIVADIRRYIDPLSDNDPDFKYDIQIPPPDSFKGRRRLVMDPLDVPIDEFIVQTVAKCHEEVTETPPNVVGTSLPMSYSANDTCHLWNAGIPCVLYGPDVGQYQDGVDDGFVSISAMVTCAKVLALTALEVCSIKA